MLPSWFGFWFHHVGSVASRPIYEDQVLVIWSSFAFSYILLIISKCLLSSVMSDEHLLNLLWQQDVKQLHTYSLSIQKACGVKMFLRTCKFSVNRITRTCHGQRWRGGWVCGRGCTPHTFFQRNIFYLYFLYLLNIAKYCESLYHCYIFQFPMCRRCWWSSGRTMGLYAEGSRFESCSGWNF